MTPPSNFSVLKQISFKTDSWKSHAELAAKQLSYVSLSTNVVLNSPELNPLNYHVYHTHDKNEYITESEEILQITVKLRVDRQSCKSFINDWMPVLYIIKTLKEYGD